MLTHDQVWAAIDALAQRYSLSPSGLAKKAGLDPTTFNKSKRTTAEGHRRWPSTESIAKILEATGATWDAFSSLLAANGPYRQSTRTLPLLGFAQAG
ncbi:MAG: helix-turn-helix transcriptional regulator, partial [Beijerinckiaceae bacterium]